jgi:hypothetical protein
MIRFRLWPLTTICGWVAPYIGMIWPTGDSGKLRAAAAAWSTAGTQFAVAEILGTGAPMGAIRAQQIPEGPAIDRAFTDAYGITTGIVQQCQKVTAQLNSYAAKIDQVHAATLDLLARICDPMTGIRPATARRMDPVLARRPKIPRTGIIQAAQRRRICLRGARRSLGLLNHPNSSYAISLNTDALEKSPKQRCRVLTTV